MDELPAVIQDIADRVSLEAAKELVRKFGGRRVYIRQAPDGSDPLSQAIGQPAAQALAKALGPGFLYVPKGLKKDIKRHARDVEICRLRKEEGLSVDELVQRFGLCCTTVYRAIRSNT